MILSELLYSLPDFGKVATTTKKPVIHISVVEIQLQFCGIYLKKKCNLLSLKKLRRFLKYQFANEYSILLCVPSDKDTNFYYMTMKIFH